MDFTEKYVKSVVKSFIEGLKNRDIDRIQKGLIFLEQHFPEINLPQTKFAEGYKILAEASNFGSQNRILNLAKAIKFEPEDLDLRIQYVDNFIALLEDNRRNLVKNNLLIVENEFVRLFNYSKLYFKDSDQLKISILTLLNKVEALKTLVSDREEGGMNHFFDNWETIKAKYRPDKQALDYASQIIYEVIVKNNTK